MAAARSPPGVSPRGAIARVLIAAAVLALAAALAGRLRLDQDIARLLPDTDPGFSRAALVLRGLLERLLVDLSVEDGEPADAEALGRAADRVAARLEGSGAAARARASFSGDDPSPFLDVLRERAPRLVLPERLEGVADRLSEAALGERLAEVSRRILEPDGAHLASSIGGDPLGISDLALAPLGDLLSGFRGLRWSTGRLTSADGRHVLVVVEPGFPATDLVRSERLLSAAAAAAEEVRAEGLRGLRIRSMGAHRSTLDNARRIKGDVARSTTIGVILIVAVAVLAFRRPWLALLALVPALFGGVFALGAFALFRDSLPAPVAGFGAVFLGATVDYAVHILFRADRRKGPPFAELCLGASATTLAFLALLASALPGMRDVGILGSVGTIAAAAFAALVLPAVPLPAGGGSRRPPLDPARLVLGLRGSGPARALAAGAALLLTVPVSLGALRLRFEGDVTRLSSLAPETRDDEARLAAAWGDVFRPSAVVVEGRTREEALEANDRLAAVLDRLRAAGTIAGHASISGILPSARTQEERLSAWRAFWSKDRVDGLRADLARAVEGTPFRADAFEGFFGWLASDPAVIGLEGLPPGPLRDLVGERIIEAGGSVLAVTPVLAGSREGVDALEEALGREVPRAELIDREGLVRRLSGMVRGEMAALGGIAFLSIFLLVFLWFGRLELALAGLLPLAIGCLWSLGLLGWLGVPVSMANAIFVALMFAAVLDYSVFLLGSRLERFRTGRDDTVETDASVLLCAATNCIGFGALAIAGHPVLSSIGLTATIGILCSLLAAGLFTPLLAGAILRFPGPNGTPSLRAMCIAAWVFGLLLRNSLGYLLVKRRRAGDPGERRRAALAVVGETALAIRHRTPFGRREYLGESPERFAAPAVIVANHESMYDIMALLALPPPVQFLVKEWVWKAPILGHVARDAGYLLVGETSFEETVERARESVRQGISILVFPEGTRSADGKVGRFHPGAFVLARRLGIPVLPVAIVGSRLALRRGTWWIGDHDVRVAVLDPVDPGAFRGDLPDQEMAREVRRRIVEARDRLWPETQAGTAWRSQLAGLYRYLGPVASHYSASKAKRDPLVGAIPQLCPGDGEVLVTGCGMGILTARLALAFPGRPIRAVDTDGRKLGLARAALGPSSPVTFVEGDIRAVDPGSPGTALLVDVLHYWPEEAQREILAAVARSLPAGGRLVFRDGCADRGRGHRLVAAGEALACRLGFTRQPGRHHFRTSEGWRRLLEGCGLVVEESRPDLGLLSNLVLVCRKGA